ncbi:MAG: DUF433 domain-containing protein [bacterium]|nr:DUF433 domain-containing protein [bacterium]
MAVAIETLLASSPDICGGRPRIGGTRITVQQLVVMYKSGFTPEEIADQYPHLDLSQVYAALAYYHANCEELESALAAEAAEAEALRRRHQKAS